MATELEKLQKQIAKLEKEKYRIQQEVANEKYKEGKDKRKADTHRKIVIGATFEKLLNKQLPIEEMEKLNNLLDKKDKTTREAYNIQMATDFIKGLIDSL